ncbi:hypothetical protein SAMN05216203_2776 [Marinobacter daqiaonensis]|uniref:Uncharacterized protein n=1 Tax=Marinobacter daqiaonensis TaxID=650891 RepID=A0A1I6J8E6_9GAMM|nr:hypothetical protein [Marinobacter daqiaonensis]SFR75265.1 hypothetical protein SAMN05216203_2776 [Marinobacter daqiaonensis]
MIGGVNSGNPYIGNGAPARERTDANRAPAARPELLVDARNDTRARPAGDQNPEGQDTQAYLRRVQARAALEDVRLEPFRSDDIPLANARAVQTFAAIANQREGLDGYDAELTGISIRV